jgi:hypothetical protein
VRLLLIRDPGSTKPYDLAQVTTDLTTPPAGIVTRYSWRWGIEVLFAQLKQVLAAGEARNQVQRAVERTVPFCLAVYTLTVIWYALNGRHHQDVAERRAQSPWFATKTTVSFEDMLTALRRATAHHRINHVIAAHGLLGQIPQALRDFVDLAA